MRHSHRVPSIAVGLHSFKTIAVYPVSREESTRIGLVGIVELNSDTTLYGGTGTIPKHTPTIFRHSRSGFLTKTPRFLSVTFKNLSRAHRFLFA